MAAEIKPCENYIGLTKVFCKIQKHKPIIIYLPWHRKTAYPCNEPTSWSSS